MDKNILKVTFKESLRLNKDEFSKWYIKKTTEDFSQKKDTDMAPVKFLIKVICMIIINYIFAVGSNFAANKSIDKPYKTPNFLPLYLFWIFLIIWLSLFILGKLFIKEKYILVYEEQFHYTITYLIWLMIEFVLFGFTMFYPIIGKIGVLVAVITIILALVLLVTYRITTLKKLLFELETNNFDKLIISIKKYLTKVLPGLLTLYFIVKSILIIFHIHLPSTSNSFIIILFLFGLICFMAVQIFMFFPFFLQGYYKYKYPEEYRVLNKQTKEEWYGKKYLKKLAKKETKK